MSLGNDLIFRYMGVTLSYAQPCLLVSDGEVVASAGSPSSIDQKKLFYIVCITLRGGQSSETADDPLEQTAQKICEIALQRASRNERWAMAHTLELHKSNHLCRTIQEAKAEAKDSELQDLQKLVEGLELKDEKDLPQETEEKKTGSIASPREKHNPLENGHKVRKSFSRQMQHGTNPDSPALSDEMRILRKKKAKELIKQFSDEALSSLLIFWRDPDDEKIAPPEHLPLLSTERAIVCQEQVMRLLNNLPRNEHKSAQDIFGNLNRITVSQKRVVLEQLSDDDQQNFTLITAGFRTLCQSLLEKLSSESEESAYLRTWGEIVVNSDKKNSTEDTPRECIEAFIKYRAI